MVSGLAYYDPTDEVGAAMPELRIYLTSWPITGCDPASISSDAAGLDGRWWLRFSITRTKNPPYPYEAFEGMPFFGNGSWEQKPAAGFLVDLSSGDDDGGEQVIGKIRLTESYGSSALTGEEFEVQVNHCGILDEPHW
jgi:hypothetical protein